MFDLHSIDWKSRRLRQRERLQMHAHAIGPTRKRHNHTPMDACSIGHPDSMWVCATMAGGVFEIHTPDGGGYGVPDSVSTDT